jgi:hypothetical protein
MRCASGASRGPRPVTSGAAAASGSGASAAAKPAAKAFRLDATPTPPRRIASSNWAGSNGSAREAASAPNSTGAIGPADSLGQRGKIGGDETCRRGVRTFQQLVRVDPAIAHGGALGHRVHAVGRDDEGGALRRYQSALQRAPGLHQLGGDHHVEFARHRRQRQHRLRAGRDCLARKQLQVIDSGAGALRHARHGGRLRHEAVVLRQVDQPVGQDAAALAAHGEQRDRDGTRLCHAASPSRRESMRACSQPITLPRTRCLKRSQRVGLLMISAR